MNPNFDSLKFCWACQRYYTGYHACNSGIGFIEPLNSTYGYRCPNCFGEFNEPARDNMGPPCHGNPRCPFCGLEMKGLE